MDLSIKDVPDRVAQYFRLLERIIMDNGFQDNLGRGSATDDNYVARMKQRTKFLVDNLSPTMLRDEIKGMLELVKYRHIRINDQLLYSGPSSSNCFITGLNNKGQLQHNIRKGNRGAAAIDNSRRTELQHRSSSRGEQTMTARSPDATTRKNVAEIPHRRPPPKTDCFHCKGEHWLKDCPLATPEEKEEVRSTKSKNWKVKRAKLRSSTDEQDVGTNKEPPHNTLVEDDDYSVIVNGTVEVSMCPDTGTEECILPASVVEQLKSAGQELIMKTLENPVPLGEKSHHETALVDLQIRTAVGPVNLYKIKCVVVEDEDQFLLSKVIMKRLGIDVKRAFEQFANTCIDLNLDDIPDEPDVDNSVQGEVEYEMNRMCNDVRTVLSDEHYASFRDEVIKLSKEFIYLYHTRIGPGEPARVEPLKEWSHIDANQGNIHQRKIKFLDEHIAQLMQFGFIKKNNLSKWASNAVPVRKSDDKTGFRVTNAYIDVNKRTVPIAGTMPHLSVVLSFVAGVKFIAKFDMFKGFWQIMLAEECQEIFSFMTHDGVYTPLRVPQGATDSALHFQNQMQTVYKPLLYKGALVWIDDVIVYGKTEEEFLANLKLFYELTAEYRLKLNAKKSVLMSFEVSWCGRIIDGEGIRQDPQRLSGLVSLPLPKTAADLQRFLCVCNWIRDSIVDFVRIFEPLQSKINGVLVNRSKTKRSASAVALSWTEEERANYSHVLQFIANAAKLYFPEEQTTVCLMTDASDHGYAIILTQVRKWQEQVAVEDQKHELLICQGGIFRGAQIRWSVVEKEAYPVVKACVSLDYILEREQGFKVFCDHSNLIQIFSPSESIKKHTRGKLLRWASRISCLLYTIEHIDGERNLWADIISRWKPALEEERQAKVRIKIARVDSQVQLSRIRPLQDENFVWPTIRDVKVAQSNISPPGTGATRNDQGIWVIDGKIWLPSSRDSNLSHIVVFELTAGQTRYCKF
ncbi:Hypothetical protein PHPALM_16832 [Phytophthora palmivora]|uniref:Reverse transcriptase domain-containing protein n=1 Tax=Phytophthora palmivora TaxID=4796 RepID=A0A2P4XNQ9_9STRA|nr:Hypothetical protein PHPALM_16832 [Phytophthora palmivora]